MATSDYLIRGATRNDFDALMQLLLAPNVKWFGNVRPKYNAKDELFKSYQTHRLVALDKETNSYILAYAEIRNYPALGVLGCDDWLDWLKSRFCVTYPISWQNTLFLNFGIYKSEHSSALKEILQELFFLESKVFYCISVKMPEVEEPSYYKEYFDDLEKYAKIFYSSDSSIANKMNTTNLYIVYRLAILPKIIYRKALPEDNDDVVEIQAFDFPDMREELGDYYIAEELMRRDKNADKTFIIVTEMEGKNAENITAGFLWLSVEIDIKFLNANYELTQFGNFVHSSNTSRPFGFDQILVSSIKPKADVSLFTQAALEDLMEMTILGGMHVVNSDITVASRGKLKVSSIDGQIFSVKGNRFYERESLFIKFHNILDKLQSSYYYSTEEIKLLPLLYNTVINAAGEVEISANVFQLKYVGIHTVFPVNRLFAFLTNAFWAYPERDYCILTIPKSAKSARSNLEILQYFTPVAQRPSEIPNLDEVFVTHRSTIHGEISLYYLQADDLEAIRTYILGDEKADTDSRGSSVSYTTQVNESANLDQEHAYLKEIFADVLENQFSEYSVLTVRCGNSLKPAKENTFIGFVALREFKDHHHLHYHYHLPKDDAYLEHKRGEIISLRLHPLFLIWADTIFRDLARKTNYCDFYYICARRQNIFCNDLKTKMMLIEPKPLKNYWTKRQTTAEHKRTKSKVKMPVHNFYNHYLILFRHKLNPAKFYGNNSKLVIIGFTEHTKAFLRQLAFQWNSSDHKNSDAFTCLPRLIVTVISLPGIVEAEYDSAFKCPYCKDVLSCYLSTQNTACYIRDVTTRMDLRYWVHFVTGRVHRIDRERKIVKLKNSCEIYYDKLLLMCHKNFSLLSGYDMDEPEKVPCNFVEVNSRIDKFMLFYKWRTLLSERPRNYLVLLYGCNLQTYECLQFLLTHGAEPSRLVLVIPHRTRDFIKNDKFKNPYRDINIQYLLEDMVLDMGMAVHSDYDFFRWEQPEMDLETGVFIVEVTFKKYPTNEEITIDCDIFISFEEGYMGSTSAKWMTASGIDVRGDYITVDKHFKTNDPDIYALGKNINITGDPNYQYHFTSEREQAMKLLQILKLGCNNQPFEYRYSQPLYFHAQLPLRHFITKITSPRRFLSTVLSNDHSCSLTTYKNKVFCRVVLSPRMLVNEIVVVSNNSSKLDYLEHFCGKHELLLNNLKASYTAGLIPCLLEFFQKPWSELIMHERFSELQSENRNWLRPIVLSKSLKLDYGFLGNRVAEEYFKLNKKFLEDGLLNFLRMYRKDFKNKFALPEDYVQQEKSEIIISEKKRSTTSN